MESGTTVYLLWHGDDVDPETPEAKLLGVYSSDWSELTGDDTYGGIAPDSAADGSVVRHTRRYVHTSWTT
jgi:hypothetical protein